MRMSELEGAAAAVAAVDGTGGHGTLAEPSSLTSALFARGLPAVDGGADPVRGTGWPAEQRSEGGGDGVGAESSTMGEGLGGEFRAAGATGGGAGWGVAALDLSASSAMDMGDSQAAGVGGAGSPACAADDDSSAMDLDESSSG